MPTLPKLAARRSENSQTARPGRTRSGSSDRSARDSLLRVQIGGLESGLKAVELERQRLVSAHQRDIRLRVDTILQLQRPIRRVHDQPPERLVQQVLRRP